MRKSRKSMLNWIGLASKYRHLIAEVGLSEKEFGVAFARRFITSVRNDVYTHDGRGKYRHLTENDPILAAEFPPSF